MATDHRKRSPQIGRYSFPLLLLAAGCAPPPSQFSTPTQRTRHVDPQFPVGEFALTERSGKTVSHTDLHGKVWVASFVFTRCTGPCPQVSATMARLQQELADKSDLRLVTFTVDPANDDSAELKRYAEHFRAHPERWLFLTGKEDEVRRLLTEQFKVAAIRNAKAKGPGDEFDHSTRLVVVDRKGLIRGYYPGVRNEQSANAEQEFEAEFAALKSKITSLLQESP